MYVATMAYIRSYFTHLLQLLHQAQPTFVTYSAEDHSRMVVLILIRKN